MEASLLNWDCFIATLKFLVVCKSEALEWIYSVTFHHCWKDPSPTNPLMSWWHRAFPPSPVLRLQVSVSWRSRVGSEDHVWGLLRFNGQRHFPSGYVSPVQRGEVIQLSRNQAEAGFLVVKDSWRRDRLTLWLPLRCMTFSARLICDADVKLHISRQRSSDGEGHSFYQALVRTVYGSHVTPVSPIWKIQLNRESFYCCWGGSRWEDGQMRRVISVTGTVSCDSRGWESNLQNEPKTVRILMTDWNLAPIC